MINSDESTCKPGEKKKSVILTEQRAKTITIDDFAKGRRAGEGRGEEERSCHRVARG